MSLQVKSNFQKMCKKISHCRN